MFTLTIKPKFNFRQAKKFVAGSAYAFPAVCCAILFSVSPAQATSNLMAQVHQDYVTGNYSAALSKLATAQPSPLVYYYSGLCYQGSNQLRMAKSQYTMVLQTSKDQQLRYHSQLAIASLERYAATRTYKGQGNKFLKPVNRNVPGGNGTTINNNISVNPMFSRGYNPRFNLSTGSQMFNPSYNPMYTRNSSTVISNPNYNPMYRR